MPILAWPLHRADDVAGHELAELARGVELRHADLRHDVGAADRGIEHGDRDARAARLVDRRP